MKLPFTPPRDNAVHTYCLGCMKEGNVSSRMPQGKLEYRCTCGHRNTRALIIDPAVEWWIDGTQEYWHEVASVFGVNRGNQFLFFERRKHPFGFTIPAGHVDIGERPLITAQREFFEEASCKPSLDSLEFIAREDITGDECRRGADAHRWHIFAAHVNASWIVINQKEGMKPVWLTLDEALKHDLTFATRYIISRHKRAIEKGR